MTTKKNSTRKKCLIITASVAVVTVLVVLNNQLDSKIANHPKIITMELTQEGIEEKIDTVLVRQQRFGEKVDNLKDGLEELLQEKCP